MEAIFVLVVISFLVCALIGFIQTLVWLIKLLTANDKHPPFPTSRPGKQPTLEEDLDAARRLIDYLHSQSQLPAEDRERLLNFLDNKIRHGDNAPLPKLSISALATRTNELSQSDAEIFWFGVLQ